MTTNRLVRVTAPGLPPRPKLMFDPVGRRAIVSMRHPTWKSHDWAMRTTLLISLTLTVVLAWLLWPRFAIPDPVGRVTLFILIVGIIYQLSDYFLQRSLRYFLARQVFATKTTLWFTMEAIAFRSRLYAKPMIIKRAWHSFPVRVRFILQPDQFAHSLAANRRAGRDHLQQSRMLEMVLTTANRQRDANYQGQDAILKTIPITQIDSWLGPRFTMVYAAAAALTAPAQNQAERSVGAGYDIDTD